VPEIELDARLGKHQFQVHFVDRRSAAFALVHGRVEVIGRVEVRCPLWVMSSTFSTAQAAPFRQILFLQPGKKRRHLREGRLMVQGR